MQINNTNIPLENQPKSSMTKKAVLTVVVLLLLASLGVAGYYYRQFENLKKNPNKTAQDETKAVIDAVGKLIVLPTGEDPTVATVTDPSKLKDQTFFAHAQVGDKVLVYTTARRAILYSPTLNKIIEVAPINIGENTTTPQPQVSGSGTENQ